VSGPAAVPSPEVWEKIARIAREKDAQARADLRIVTFHQWAFGPQPEDAIVLGQQEPDDELFIG
jgi:hypothetical protein